MSNCDRNNIKHAVDVMQSLEKMKQRNFLCDFKILVGKHTFPVHRTVLAACSDYFEAMFSSEMKEVHEGFVHMKDVDPSAVKQCIEFMYTGDPKISTTGIQNVLYVSSLLQLGDLTDYCFFYLLENLSPENCFCYLSLSQIYCRENVSEVLHQYIRENLKCVIDTEAFLSITTTSLLRYVLTSTDNHILLWKAIYKWLSHNYESIDKGDQQLSKIMHFVNLHIFPFDFLLDIAIPELWKLECEKGVELLLGNIFSDTEKLKSNLRIKNCFQLLEYSNSRTIIPHSDVGNDVIFEFVSLHFEKLFNHEMIKRLSTNAIVKIFQGPMKDLKIQQLAWEAALKWVNHTPSRTEDFSEIFQSITLKNIPFTFIKQTVLKHHLVQQSLGCLQHILKSVKFKGSHNNTVPCIAVLNMDTNEIQTLEMHCRLWARVSNIPDMDFRRIVSSRDNLFILGDGRLMRLQDESWTNTAPIGRRKPSPWAQVVSFQNFIYVVDGKSMWLFNPKVNTWIENLPGCVLVMGFFVAADTKNIYAIGGATAKSYDSISKSWSQIASPKVQRYDASAAAIDGRVYVMGGTLFGQVFKSVECYHRITDSWTDIHSMCFPRSHFSACVVENKLFAVGGARNADQELEIKDSVEAYTLNPSHPWERWQVITTMPNSKSRVLACQYSPDVTNIIDKINILMSNLK